MLAVVFYHLYRVIKAGFCVASLIAEHAWLKPAFQKLQLMLDLMLDLMHVYLKRHSYIEVPAKHCDYDRAEKH